MVIKDVKGQYEINVDTIKRISSQKHAKGLMDADTMDRLHKDYVNQVIPSFNGKPFAKVVDLRGFNASPVINQKMDEHNKYCIQHGMQHAAIIVESAIVKMQMNASGRNVQFAPEACINEEEAYKYLSEKGYK
jgi:hypothetical protein